MVSTNTQHLTPITKKICESKINTFSWQKQIICNKFYLFYYNFLIKMTNIIKKSNKSQLLASDIINVSLPTMQNTIWYTEINGIYGHLYTKLYSIYWNTVYCGGVEFLITLHQLYIYTPCHKQRWCKGVYSWCRVKTNYTSL